MFLFILLEWDVLIVFTWKNKKFWKFWEEINAPKYMHVYFGRVRISKQRCIKNTCLLDPVLWF